MLLTVKEMVENFEPGSDGEAKASVTTGKSAMQFEFAGADLSDIHKIQVKPEDLEQFRDKLPPGMIENYAEQPPELVEPDKIPTNPGVEIFSEVDKELKREQITAVRDKFPKMDQALEAVDKHLFDTIDAYEKRPELREMLKLGTNIGNSMYAVNEYVGDSKNILMHTDKVEVMQMVNSYLSSKTEAGEKPGILAKLKEMGHGDIVDHVVKIDEAQMELQPLYREDARERAKVHLAYEEAGIVRTGYMELLTLSLQDYTNKATENGPLEGDEKRAFERDRTKYGFLFRTEFERQTRFKAYGQPVKIPKNLDIQFKMPTPPRTHTA